MSIEGLWSVDFGFAGGIAVMETGRVYGGDSWFAYTGNYEVDRDSVSAHLRIQRHNRSSSGIDLWRSGDDMDEVDVILMLTGDQLSATGLMTEARGKSVLPVAVIMKKLSELLG